MATLKQLADLANVSVSTVSKALNDAEDVGQETRDRILELARQHGYARSRRRRTQMPGQGPRIALIYSDPTSNYYTRLIEEFDNRILELGGICVMSCARFETRRIIELVDYFNESHAVDGVICISALNVFGHVPKPRLPMVGISYPSSETHAFDCISVQDRVGIHEGVQRLRELGHSRVAFLSEQLTGHRLQFFREAMEHQGLPVDESLIKVSDKRFEQAGYESMHELLTGGNLPTAVFAAYDDVAVGASKAIYAAGLSIPGDISICGVDNTGCTVGDNKRLASVNCHIEEQVSIALRLLLKKVRDPSYGVLQDVNLQTNFAEHQTLAPPRTEPDRKLAARIAANLR